MKDEAVEVRLQILRADVLVRSAQRSLHMRPEPVDGLGVCFATNELAFLVMHAVPLIWSRHVVELECLVRHELCVLRRHVLPEKVLVILGRTACDNLRPRPSFALNRSEYSRLGPENLFQMLAILARVAFAAEVREIELHLARERLLGLLERTTDEVRHPPRALVCDLQIALNGLRRKAALRVREHHERVEPECEGYLGLLKDRPCKRRDLKRAAGAVVLLASLDARERAAARTAHAMASLEHVFEACVI